MCNDLRKWDFENRNLRRHHDRNDERRMLNHDVPFLPLHWIDGICGWQYFTITCSSWFIKDLTVQDAEALEIEVFLGRTIRMAHGTAFLFFSPARTARIADASWLAHLASPFVPTVLDADIYITCVASLRAILSFFPSGSTWTTRGFFRDSNCTRHHL